MAGSAEAGSASKAVFRCGAEVMPVLPKESATTSKSGREALAAEVAEKSGAALSVSKIGLGDSTCACATLTLPSSNNVHAHNNTTHAHKLFMICLSEGCPTLRHSHRYGKQQQGFCLRSFA